MKAPLINGKEYSWSSIVVNLLGVALTGITAISYQESQEIAAIYGAGNKPVASGDGQVSFEGSITLLSGDVRALELASPTGRLQDIPPFPVVVSYQAGEKITVHRLQACRFTQNGRSASTGDTSIAVEMPLFVGDIKWR